MSVFLDRRRRYTPRLPSTYRGIDKIAPIGTISRPHFSQASPAATRNASTLAVLTAMAEDEKPKRANNAAITNIPIVRIASNDSGGTAKSSVSASKFQF